MKRSIYNRQGEVVADVYGETEAEVEARIALYSAVERQLERENPTEGLTPVGLTG